MARTDTRRSNEEWLSALRGTDSAAEDAQRELRLRIRGALQKATGSFGPLDEATLEDLTQIAVMRVLAKLDRFEGRSQFTTWAYSVAVRAAFSELRKSHYRAAPLAVDETPDAEVVPDTQPAATESLERQEIVDILYRVIEEELTDRQRRAILAELRGTPMEAIEKELGTNRNALYKLMHDARLKLRAGLDSAGFSDEEVRGAFDL